MSRIRPWLSGHLPLPAASVVWLLAGLVLAACGGSKASSASLGANNELHFLLASDRGLVEINGTKQRTILSYNDGSYLLDPALSADGTKIAFALQSPAVTTTDGSVDFGSDLYVVNRDGTNKMLLVKHAAVAEFDRAPAWLPDGRLLFTVYGRAANGDADLRIEVLDLQTGARSRVVANGTGPALAPDGSGFIYDYVDPADLSEQLTFTNLDGTQTTRLAGTTDNLALITSQAWSPDSSQIAFAAVDLTVPQPSATPLAPGQTAPLQHPAAQDIWLVNRDGSNLHKLVDLAETQPSLDWSADGSHIYVLGATGFWHIDAKSGAKEPVSLGVPLGQIKWLWH